MTIIEIVEKEYELVPAGTHDAIILAVRERPGKTGLRITFQFETTLVGQGGQRLTCIKSVPVPKKMTPGTDLVKFVQAILGGQLQPGQRFDPQKLVGKRVRITVKHEENENDGRIWDNVTRIVPSADAATTDADKKPMVGLSTDDNTLNRGDSAIQS